ncbi:MAG: hypothetical protein U0992_15995 [Planctomycetaceae bacterium]
MIVRRAELALIALLDTVRIHERHGNQFDMLAEPRSILIIVREEASAIEPSAT